MSQLPHSAVLSVPDFTASYHCLILTAYMRFHHRFGAQSMARDASMGTPGESEHSSNVSESTSSGTWSSPLGSFSHLYPTNSPSAPATSCSQAHLQVPESCRSDISPVQNCQSLTNMFIVPPRSGTRCCWRRYHCRSGRPGHHHISCCCLKTDC